MKRVTVWTALGAVIVCAAPILHADVKTSQKTTFKLAGVAGALMSRFGGSAAKDGLTSNIAVRGNRKSSINDLTGTIVDLGEQKVYTLDVKKKEYTVKTFAEMRAEFEKERADAAKNMQNAQPAAKEAPPQNANQPQMEFDVNVKDTGQHKTIIGHDTHEVILTITGRQKGQTLEQGGGFVMTNDMWLGPKIAALDEVRAFDMKYFEALYGESVAMEMQQMAQMAAMYPQFQSMAGRMQAEGGKIQGTPLSTTSTFDSVKSADQMKQAADTQAQPPPPSSGGGFGSMFAKKLMPASKSNSAQQARTTAMTTTMDVLSVDTAVSDADVALPAGFKEKK